MDDIADYERQLDELTTKFNADTKKIRWLVERERLFLHYDLTRYGPPLMEIWGKGCWRKGQTYSGPFSFYNGLHDGCAVLYQVGKQRPTSREEGYYGDWSGVAEFKALLQTLDRSTYPELYG
ncbi:MAG: hypothetical protein K0R85_325 [Devosia sp.]|jgi:hypothetical protein|nr:hypothetical protein [Devosia sp.]